MKFFYTLLTCWLLNLPLLAQTNYVQRTANSATPPGNYNSIVGTNAGNLTMTGTSNSFFGNGAGTSNTTGVDNSFIGVSAGTLNTTGSKNSFLGSQAGNENSTGNNNSFIGHQAGTYNTQGINNSFLGAQAGHDNTTGGFNVFVGYQAGFSNSSASNNVFIGYRAGLNNTTGVGNLFMGNGAGAGSNGSYNLFIGNGSGGNNVSGLGNTFIGDGSGYGNAYGQNNTYIGRAANFSGNAFGSQNTFIGYQARTTGGNVDNATAIGVNAIVTQSNSIILGTPGARVGIGNSAPGNILEVTSGTSAVSGLRFTNLTSANVASVTNQFRFLTVNAQGDVILGSLSNSNREGVSESLWQRNGSFLQSTQNDAVIIGEGVSKTPSDYNLFVSKGILTEKVKVAVRNTFDWSDYVFKSGYSLKPLADVERYIQQHEHLPGIPSASEVVEKGVDVARMDAKLLEKIEELTLYSIQLEKETKGQKAELQELKSEMIQLKVAMKQFLETNRK